MARWTWNAALICAALGHSACGGDGTQARGDQADAAAVQPGGDEESDSATEEDELEDGSADPEDGGREPDATAPQLDSGAGEDAASLDGAMGLDAQSGADAQAEAGPTSDGGGQPDGGQPDVQAPPVCNADCSSHGSCTLTGGASSCQCDVGYAGASCNSCSSGYTRNAGDGRCLALASVVEVRAVPPDGTCATGGHTVLEGVDADLNGSLEPSEVTKQQTVCKVVRTASVTITNAAELESLRGVTDITGTLIIKAPFITSLEPLKMLINIGNSLQIEGSNSLVDLKGLSWLDSLGGALTIRANAALRSTEGMTALRQIAGSVTVESNPALTQLHLGPLQVVQGDLSVTNQAELLSFEGTRLRSVVGALRLSANPKLETLDALAGLKAIGGALVIMQCNALTHVRGLSLLNDVGPLTIEDNSKLADVSALAALRSVRGSLTLFRLPALQVGLGDSQLTVVSGHMQFKDTPLLLRLGSFPKLTSLAALVVVRTGVDEIEPFSALTTFGGTTPCNPQDPFGPPCTPLVSFLTIEQNPVLRRFGGFPLRTNGQALSIPNVSFYDDPQLTQLEALPFTTVSTALRLEDLPSLRTLPWLGLLQAASSMLVQKTGLDRIELPKLATSTTLTIRQNPNATLLAIALKPTFTTLEIAGNAALTTLSFPTLTQLANLTISDNPVLGSFELPQLAQITTQATLARNAALTGFSLPKLNTLSTFTVDDNDALTALPALTFTLPQQLGTGLLRVANNGALTRLSTVNAMLLTVEIVNNDALKSLEGFALNGTGFQLSLEGNYALLSLAGMQSTSIGQLTLIGNDTLTRLDGPPGTVGAVEIRDNVALTSLAGLDFPNTHFWLINNDALTNLDGMLLAAGAENYGLRIEDNAVLNSLTGLNNLNASYQTFSIQNNAALPQCAAVAFGNRVAGSGARTITGNNTTATCP